MKGYIKMESANHEGKAGISVQTDLHDVSYMDRIVLVNSMCRALRINSTELKLMADLIGSGLMEGMIDTRVLEDNTEVGKPESKECKRANVKIIGGDAEDMLELLKDLLR